jgi:hypothetical protein
VAVVPKLGRPSRSWLKPFILQPFTTSKDKRCRNLVHQVKPTEGQPTTSGPRDRSCSCRYLNVNLVFISCTALSQTRMQKPSHGDITIKCAVQKIPVSNTRTSHSDNHYICLCQVRACDRRSLTAETRIQSHGSICGIRGTRCDTRTGSSPSTSIFP